MWLKGVGYKEHRMQLGPPPAYSTRIYDGMSGIRVQVAQVCWSRLALVWYCVKYPHFCIHSLCFFRMATSSWLTRSLLFWISWLHLVCWLLLRWCEICPQLKLSRSYHRSGHVCFCGEPLSHVANCLMEAWNQVSLPLYFWIIFKSRHRLRYANRFPLLTQHFFLVLWVTASIGQR